MNLKLLRKRFFLLFLLLPAVSALPAQTRTVKGTVYDSDGKTPLIGVSVIVQGANPPRGTATAVDGTYSLSVDEKDVLLFSYVGYDNATAEVGTRTRIDQTMTSTAQQIEGVVVTALGLTRQQKALGYAVTKVDNEDLTGSVSNNWLNSMSGKVAGLNFDQASAGPGGSVRVTLRGESSVNLSNNTALFVIDGVPMSNSTNAMGGSAYDNPDASVDYGNGAADINPEDIENISVLKGPAATALYGSRAANGAIVITTKAGRTTKGLGVSFSSNFSFERAGFWPDFQDEYGPGSTGSNYYSFYNVKAAESTTGEAANRTYSRFTWGPRYEGQRFYQWASLDPATGKYTPLPFEPRDWYKGFFETGATYKNSVSISGNDGKGGMIRVSFTDLRNTWIVPNTGYDSQSFAVSFEKQFKFFRLGGKVNYYRKDSDNLPMIGYSTASPTYTLIWSRNNLDIGWYEQEYREKRYGGTLSLNALSDNPYLQTYEQLNTIDRDRVFGNVNVTFDIYKGLKLMLRTGLDKARDFSKRQKPKRSISAVNGYYREQTIHDLEMNNDFLLTYERDMRKFHMNLTFGGNSMYQERRVTTSTADGLLTDGVYNLANAMSGVITKAQHRRKMINSLYGMVQFSYDDFLYLDVTGRNDWSSTLARGNWSYFYPSVSGSVVLTDIKRWGLRQKLPWLTFLKLRASWANVGNDTQPYAIDDYYVVSDFASAFSLPTSLAFRDLKPENVESWEVGLEAKMFRNRFTIDAAFYNNISTNQIINAPVDAASGRRTKWINAGKIRNRGVELAARIQPVRTKNFRWDVNLTWSKNWNRVLELAPGVDSWVISSGARGQVIATVGGSLGDLYGYGYQKAEEGSYILNPDGSRIDVSGQTVVDSNGYPQLATEKMEKLGNVQPDWKAGLSTSFAYRNLRLSATFAGQWGGKAHSLSYAQLSRQGKLTNTLYGRYGGVLHEGVVPRGLDAQGNMVYARNTNVTSDAVTYYMEYVYSMNNVENSVFSTSYLKLRELRLEYSLPKKWMTRTGFLQGVTVAVFGTNLFCWTDWPIYDPEVGTINGGQITRGFETASYPMTRTYGFNIKLDF